MAEPAGAKPYAARWRLVEDLPPEAAGWGASDYGETVARWRRVRHAMEDRKVSRYLIDIWLRERRRAFAIETGQIEGLYHLRRGVTEQLITEGFEGVRGSHSVDPTLDDDTLRGLLLDQERTLEIIFDMAKGGTPLSNSTLKGLHQILTEHQEFAVGFNPITRERFPTELRKGQYKKWPNNPRRLDGQVHEYCPPEQVDSEMDQFLEFHRSHADRNLPTEVEAAWLHHAFVRIHPFQDGNGRLSRLLMAYAFVRNGEFPPVITELGRADYLTMLGVADNGNLKAFVHYLAQLSKAGTMVASALAEDILAGRDHLQHGNGGLTANGKYYPPDDDSA